MSVSICVPTYNRESYLAQTLESIYAQNYPAEVVIVDDGSTDGTKAVCDRFPVQYFYLDRPHPASWVRAANASIRQATGDICILQSAEVVHQGTVIEPLAHAIEASPMTFVIARVIAENEGLDYTGTSNPRPFFFLGAILRQHLLDIRGLDEDFVEQTYDDNDLADRLMRGLGLTPKFRDDIVGLHKWHPRSNVDESLRRMGALYYQKTMAWNRGEISHVRNLDREWGQL